MDDALREAVERGDRLEALADRLAERVVEAEDLAHERLRQLRHAEERLRYVIGRPS